MTNPIDHLIELQEAANSGAVSDDTARWFDRGLSDFFLENVPLERALGLNGGQGKRRARTLYLTSLRNRHLQAAWLLFDDLKPWQRSTKLADEILKFETRCWPRWKHLDDPPERATELQQHLFKAFNTNLKLPGLRLIHDICKAQ